MVLSYVLFSERVDSIEKNSNALNVKKRRERISSQYWTVVVSRTQAEKLTKPGQMDFDQKGPPSQAG